MLFGVLSLIYTFLWCWVWNPGPCQALALNWIHTILLICLLTNNTHIKRKGHIIGITSNMEVDSFTNSTHHKGSSLPPSKTDRTPITVQFNFPFKLSSDFLPSPVNTETPQSQNTSAKVLWLHQALITFLVARIIEQDFLGPLPSVSIKFILQSCQGPQFSFLQ